MSLKKNDGGQEVLKVAKPTLRECSFDFVANACVCLQYLNVDKLREMFITQLISPKSLSTQVY